MPAISRVLYNLYRLLWGAFLFILLAIATVVFPLSFFMALPILVLYLEVNYRVRNRFKIKKAEPEQNISNQNSIKKDVKILNHDLIQEEKTFCWSCNQELKDHEIEVCDTCYSGSKIIVDKRK